MRFKTFLNEEVQLLKSFKKDNQVVDLGSIGWFRVYTVVERPATKNLFLTLKDYQEYKEGDKPEVSEDYIIDSKLNEVKQYTLEATKLLYKLGIKKRKSILIISDLTNEGNVSGFASKKEHGIAIDYREIGKKLEFIKTLTHETIHTIYFELPKASKVAFDEWFKINIEKQLYIDDSDFKTIAKELEKELKDNYKKKHGTTLESDRKNKTATYKKLHPVQKITVKNMMKKFKKTISKIWSSADLFSAVVEALVFDIETTDLELGQLIGIPRDYKEKTKDDVRELRKYLANTGKVPSAYSTVNASEMFAEIGSYLSAQPKAVSKELKNSFRDIIQGSFK
jgi:hypothetical protein